MRASTETTEFLRRSLGQEGGEVKIISTHASMVFIGREHALKLKLPVRYPYLDFSTPEKRLAACRNEYELNRRTAPKLYLRTRSITRSKSGALEFDGSGALVDAVVKMRTFAQADLFDAMAQRGAMTRSLIGDLASRIARFHDEAPVSSAPQGAARVRAVLDINDRSLRACELAPITRYDVLGAKFISVFEQHADLLETRAAAGKVRRCHGDLTLRNICLYEGEPTPFDCLEFNEELATIDVLYDVSFLLMDLWVRDQRELANWCLNRYLDARDETDGLPLLPFFMAMRACVRAHVSATQALNSPNGLGTLLAEAGKYLALVEALLDTPAPRLVAIGGLSGTGKSTLAAALACEMGPAPGARVLSSDRIRKRLRGVPATTRLPADAYRSEISQQVYAILRKECVEVLKTGCACIVEAVFDRLDDREAVEAIARDQQCAFTGLWLEAPAATAESRIASRRNDPSDATLEVLRKQMERQRGVIGWTRIDAAGNAEETLQHARSAALPSR